MNNNNLFTYHKEDITPILKNRQYEIFVHGCNCFNSMGAGVAKIVKKYTPQVIVADNTTKKGDESKLGTVTVAELPNGKMAVNAYTQYDVINFDNDVLVDYEAVKKCFKQINEIMDKNGYTTLTIPKIGVGIGGGDWDTIKSIINDELKNKNIEIYYQ